MENFEKLSEKMEINLTKAKKLLERFKNLAAAKAADLKKLEELETGNALLLEQTEELSSHLEELDSLVEGLAGEAEALGADITEEEFKESYPEGMTEAERTSLESGGAVTTALNVDNSTGEQVTPNINPFS